MTDAITVQICCGERLIGERVTLDGAGIKWAVKTILTMARMKKPQADP